jgi:hypothetical protein
VRVELKNRSLLFLQKSLSFLLPPTYFVSALRTSLLYRDTELDNLFDLQR